MTVGSYDATMDNARPRKNDIEDPDATESLPERKNLELMAMTDHNNHRDNDSDIAGKIKREPVDVSVKTIIDTILSDELTPLCEEPGRDDWSFIFKTAMDGRSSKAFIVDPREPDTIIIDLGYMPDWMTFNVMTTVDGVPMIMSLTAPEMQLVTLHQIKDWTKSIDYSYWLSSKDASQGCDLIGALNDWASMGRLKFTRSPRIDASWVISEQ